MNLDDLKIELQHSLEKKFEVKSIADLKQAVHSKASHVVHKLIRSLNFEYYFSIFFLGLFLAIGLKSKHESIRIYFGSFAVLIAAFIILLYFLKQKTIKLSTNTLSVKQNLNQLHHLLNEFKKRYMQFTMGLLPVAMIFSFYLGFMFQEDLANNVVYSSLPTFKNDTQVYWFFAIYFIALMIGTYYFTKWYLNKLYGKHLQQLRELIDALEE